MTETETTSADVKDGLGSLRALNKVSFGIWEQCKLITDLTYQMDDVQFGETVLGQLTELYRKMYDACQKDALILPLQKEHLKFTTLGGQRKKRGLFHSRRIIPLYQTKTVKACQAKASRFRRKPTSHVTETTITEMLSRKLSDDDDNETPMEVSDGEGNVVPFIDLVLYRGQDEIWEKVLKTPGLLKWQSIHCQVKFFYNLCTFH